MNKISTKPKKYWEHNNPIEIWIQGEAVFRLVFVAEEFANQNSGRLQNIAKVNYFVQQGTLEFGLRTIAASNLALSLEMFFKCLTCIETGRFYEGHNLSDLFNEISKERQDLIIKYSNEIGLMNVGFQINKSLNKDVDFSFHAKLKRASKAFEQFRYSFATDEFSNFDLSDIAHATRRLIKQINPEWPTLMGLF